MCMLYRIKCTCVVVTLQSYGTCGEVYIISDGFLQNVHEKVHVTVNVTLYRVQYVRYSGEFV